MSEELDALFQELDDESDEPNDALNIPEASEKKAPEQSIILKAEPQSPPVDVIKYHAKLDIVTEEVLTACKQDRAEIQEVVNLMFDEIREDRDNGRIPSRGYTDNLTKLLETKANVNMMAVKIMEVNAKMLAATKAGSLTVNNNNLNIATGDDYLKDILANPMDDEY
jgi:hypothetical protein